MKMIRKIIDIIKSPRTLAVVPVLLILYIGVQPFYGLDTLSRLLLILCSYGFFYILIRKVFNGGV